MVVSAASSVARYSGNALYIHFPLGLCNLTNVPHNISVNVMVLMSDSTFVNHNLTMSMIMDVTSFDFCTAGIFGFSDCQCY